MIIKSNKQNLTILFMLQKQLRFFRLEPHRSPELPADPRAGCPSQIVKYLSNTPKNMVSCPVNLISSSQKR